MALTAEDGVLDGGIAADAAVGPDDGVADRGLFFNLCLPADHRVRADAGAGLDEHALVDETGSLDRRACFELNMESGNVARSVELLRGLRSHDLPFIIQILGSYEADNTVH